MRVPFHQVDAFTSRAFAGNPAAVVQLTAWPDDALLGAIAAENNLSETAFVVRSTDGPHELRWFTPGAEVPLCGHATLATAHVLFAGADADRTDIVFATRQSGELTVRRAGDGAYVMDFPAIALSKCGEPAELAGVLGVPCSEVLGNERSMLAVVADEGAVRRSVPDPLRVLELERAYLIVTAPGGDGTDFVSRFFAPALGVPEDPVTGSAHCALAPFWAVRLGRTTLRARQVSVRGGDLTCEVRGDRVLLTGAAVTVIEGEFTLPG